MSDYLPYIVSVVCAVIAAVTSVIVSLIQIKQSKKDTRELLEAEKEKLKADYDNKIKLLREEYALKAGAQIITDVVNQTVASVYDTPAVKNELNKQAQRAMKTNNRPKSGK